MKFVCRMCRKEVTRDGDVYNHVYDGSPACIVTVAGTEAPSWDRHEVLEDSATEATEEKEIPSEGVEEGEKEEGVLSRLARETGDIFHPKSKKKS